MKRRNATPMQVLARLFEEAAEAWRRQDYGRSINLLERASKISPTDSTILLNLGQAYGMRYDLAAAVDCFERAIRISPQKVDALVSAGHSCWEFGNFAMAENYLKRAIAGDDVPTAIFVELAEIYERRSRMDEAADMIVQALHRDGNCATARLVSARFDRLAGRLEDAERRLRVVLSKTETVEWTRARVWYELGAVLDKQGRYDEAMTALGEAKKLLSLRAGPYKAESQLRHQRVREFEAALTSELLGRWRDVGKELQPDRSIAFLGGHPRSGTTLLEQILDSHPGIISAEESHIFHDEAYLPLTRNFSKIPILSILESTSVAALQNMRAQYFKIMELFLGNPLGNRLLIDKNPSLTVLMPAILRLFPEIKVLIALRDPRDICLSCFMQPLALNSVSSAYLTMEGTVLEYVSVMGLWRSIAPKIQTPHLEVRYEDLVHNLEQTARRVLAFLGIEWSEQVLHFDQHARQKLVISPTYSEVTRPVSNHAIGRWRNYQKYIEPYFDKLEPFIGCWRYD
jgi:tetratricopeptide (TPR) repeat protein